VEVTHSQKDSQAEVWERVRVADISQGKEARSRDI